MKVVVPVGVSSLMGDGDTRSPLLFQMQTNKQAMYSTPNSTLLTAAAAAATVLEALHQLYGRGAAAMQQVVMCLRPGQ